MLGVRIGALFTYIRHCLNRLSSCRQPDSDKTTSQFVVALSLNKVSGV